MGEQVTSTLGSRPPLKVRTVTQGRSRLELVGRLAALVGARNKHKQRVSLPFFTSLCLSGLIFFYHLIIILLNVMTTYSPVSSMKRDAWGDRSAVGVTPPTPPLLSRLAGVDQAGLDRGSTPTSTGLVEAAC